MVKKLVVGSGCGTIYGSKVGCWFLVVEHRCGLSFCGA